MTEKEYLERFQNEPPAHWSLQAARRGLALAKEAGAKFDPEPVGLPVLTFVVDDSRRAVTATVCRLDLAEDLTPAQAQEVVRRCNAWPELRIKALKLRDVLAQQLQGGEADALLAILDGRKP